MRNIIFLDVDGVLNSESWNAAHGQEIEQGILIDGEKVKLLSRLVQQTKAWIILHSGWRMWFDAGLRPLRREAEKLMALLAEEDLCIAGTTPDLTTEEIRRTKKFSLVKADEILAWLDANPDVSHWVVLDDLQLNHEQIRVHQVMTDATVGLTITDVQKAQTLLSGHP